MSWTVDCFALSPLAGPQEQKYSPASQKRLLILMLKAPHTLNAYMPRWGSATTNGDHVVASNLSSCIVSVKWSLVHWCNCLETSLWNALQFGTPFFPCPTRQRKLSQPGFPLKQHMSEVELSPSVTDVFSTRCSLPCYALIRLAASLTQELISSSRHG